MTTIKINFTISVDIEAYMREYGCTKEQAIENIKALVRDAGTAELTENGFIPA